MYTMLAYIFFRSMDIQLITWWLSRQPPLLLSKLTDIYFRPRAEVSEKKSRAGKVIGTRDLPTDVETNVLATVLLQMLSNVYMFLFVYSLAT